MYFSWWVWTGGDGGFDQKNLFNCLMLCKQIFNKWNDFYVTNNLIIR